MSKISLGSGLEHVIDNVRANVWAVSVVLNWITKIADGESHYSMCRTGIVTEKCFFFFLALK